MNTIEMQTHVLVIGGGTGGPMAAVKAKESNPALWVMLLEKANVKRNGAISMGMDGLNNAVIPGHATPEQYLKEITIANDGIVNRRTVMAFHGAGAQAQGSDPRGVPRRDGLRTQVWRPHRPWTSGRKASTALSDGRAAMSAPATTPMLDETTLAHILNSEVPNVI